MSLVLSFTFTDEQERVQKKTFVNWINSYLAKVSIIPISLATCAVLIRANLWKYDDK